MDSLRVVVYAARVFSFLSRRSMLIRQNDMQIGRVCVFVVARRRAETGVIRSVHGSTRVCRQAESNALALPLPFSSFFSPRSFVRSSVNAWYARREVSCKFFRFMVCARSVNNVSATCIRRHSTSLFIRQELRKINIKISLCIESKTTLDRIDGMCH